MFEDKGNNFISFSLTPRRCATVLVVIVFFVTVIGTLANYGIYHVADTPESNLAKVLSRFDLGHEPSIPNFYSAIAILIAAALLTLIGRLEQLAKIPRSVYWYALALVFLGLAIDEAVLFHEMIDSAIKGQIDTSGVLFLPWVVVGGIFAVIFAVVFIPFVASRSRRTLWMFVTAGGIFIAGSLGMEMIASLIFQNAGSEQLGVQQISHTISQSIEEFFEMFGIVIFIYALLDYLASHFRGIEIRFSAESCDSKETN